MPSFTPPKGVGGKRFDQTDTPTCGQATTFNCCSDMWEATTITGGESNTSSNSGCGDGWALAKCGVDLPFKSLITTSPLATTVNATDLTLTVDNIPVSALADGTDGQLITWDAAGAPATVATGCATQVLTSNGVGAAPTFQAAAGGGGFTTVYKANDQTINCDSTLTDDLCLQFCICANSTYAIITFLFFNSNATPDFQYNTSLPACATGRRLDDSWTSNLARNTQSITSTEFLTTNSCEQTTGYYGHITSSCTAGTVAIQWAQLSSNAANTILRKGSWVAYKKLS